MISPVFGMQKDLEKSQRFEFSPESPDIAKVHLWHDSSSNLCGIKFFDRYNNLILRVGSQFGILKTLDIDDRSQIVGGKSKQGVNYVKYFEWKIITLPEE